MYNYFNFIEHKAKAIKCADVTVNKLTYDLDF